MLPPISLIDEEVPPTGEQGEHVAPVQHDVRFYEDLLSDGWPSIWFGIALAGAAYPITLGAFFTVLAAGASMINARFGPGWDVGTVVMMAVGSFMSAGAAAIIGLIWSSLVMVPTVPFLHFVVWSLNLRLGLVWLGAFSGGLVGFMAILPVAIGIPRVLDSGSPLEALAMMLAGPGLTTVLGQVGGYWGGSRGADNIGAKRMATSIELLRLKYAIGQGPAVEQSKIDSEPALANFDGPQFRFRIAHLLWIGVWMSILLTVIRLSGIPYELILPVLLVWLAYQATTLSIGLLLVRRLGPWWRKRRQIRST